MRLLRLETYARHSGSTAEDGFVEVPDNPLWNFGTNDFTIEMWARFNSIRNASYHLIGHDEGPGDAKKWILALSGGYFRFHVNSPNLHVVQVRLIHPAIAGITWHLPEAV